MSNLDIYNAVRQPPKEACKDFRRAGGFQGTEINPMWRIKMLTELFGPCGLGWYVEVVERWTESYDVSQVKAFVTINLYIKDAKTGRWSKPIVGTGGNDFITRRVKRDNFGNRVQGQYEIVLNDDCYKMAETDALGSACKKLGIGADIYWSSDKTKYTSEDTEVVEDDEKNKKTKTNTSDPFFSKKAPVEATKVLTDEEAKAVKTDRPMEVKRETVAKMARRANVNEVLRPIAKKYSITPQTLLSLDKEEIPAEALDEMYVAVCATMRAKEVKE